MEYDVKTEAVQTMQNYIEAHVFDVITPGDLARISGYSPWYTARLFAQKLNMTPAEYIRRLKLSKSALRLRDEDIRITDIAFETGFESVDGYQRAFLREFGCNPHEYAHNPIPIWLFMPYPVINACPVKEHFVSDVKTIFVQTIEKPARKVIIKRGIKATEYFEYCDEVGCDVWGLLSSIKSLTGEPVCMWLPEHLVKAGTSLYVQGAEVESSFKDYVPDDLDIIDLPAATYLMFCGEPFKEEDYEQAILHVQAAVKKYDLSLSGFVWDKANPRIQLEPRGERGYIELLPVKKISN